jgi:hypothetical protein
VERCVEDAGVGGSSPSLGTNIKAGRSTRLAGEHCLLSSNIFARTNQTLPAATELSGTSNE